MLVKDYFKTNQQKFVNEGDKLHIYHAFLDKKFKKQRMYSRSFLHVRSLTYSFIVIFFLIGLYGSEIFYQNNVNIVNEGIKITPENWLYVNADYIAKIVDFVGKFTITNQRGQEVQTSNIWDGDIVTLFANTQLKFNIDEWTQATLIWPAKFTISKQSNDQYKLNVIEWNYLEMKSLEASHSQDVQVAVDDMILRKDEKKPVDFKYIKNSKESVIRNNWAKLSVYTDGNKNPIMRINAKQMAMVTDKDISLLNDSKDFKDALSNKQIIQKFVFEDNSNVKVDSIKIDKDTFFALIGSGGEDISDVTVDTNPVVWSDDRQILTDAKLNEFKSLISQYFVNMDIKSLSDSILENNKNAISVSLSNLNKRINQLCGVFWTVCSSSTSTTEQTLVNMQKNVHIVKALVTSWYYIPESYLSNLDYLYAQISKVITIMKESQSHDSAPQSWGLQTWTL